MARVTSACGALNTLKLHRLSARLSGSSVRY